MALTGNIVFDGDIIIKKGVTVTLDNATLITTPCTRITLEKGDLSTNGGKLIIKNGTAISSCGTWEGIVVEGIANLGKSGTDKAKHGTLEINSPSGSSTGAGTQNRLNDALTAIRSIDGGNLNIDKIDFNYNDKHIVIEEYTITDHDAVIRNANFGPLQNMRPYTTCTNLLPFYPVSSSAPAMVYIENAGGIEIGTATGANTFKPGNHLNRVDGIVIVDGKKFGRTYSVRLRNSEFDGMIATGLYAKSGEYL